MLYMCTDFVNYTQARDIEQLLEWQIYSQIISDIFRSHFESWIQNNDQNLKHNRKIQLDIITIESV